MDTIVWLRCNQIVILKDNFLRLTFDNKQLSEKWLYLQMFLNSATRVKSQKPYWIDNCFQAFSMESNFQLLHAIARVSTMLAGESGTEFWPHHDWMKKREVIYVIKSKKMSNQILTFLV